MEKLLLFDVDGTLVDTEGAGLHSLQDGIFAAFPELEGKPFPPLDLGGATDGSVVAFLFEEFGVEDHEQHRKRFFDFYLEALGQRLRSFEKAGKGKVLEGVVPLLESLKKARPHWTLGLLTGNTEAGARTKLRHYQIDHYFELGAYGDDHSDRNELGPIALQRAEEDHGLKFDPVDTVIIGDTPKDVACARAFGAHVVAVATGASSREDLDKAGPDRLLMNLSETSLALEVFVSLFDGS